MFIKAQIVFWLLGATDGHAKNFSIFLEPGGRFSLTPLYDVMSAQPAVDSGQLRRSRYKLALAVGDNRHYVMATIQPRHFVQTALRQGMDSRVVGEVCAELADTAVRVDRNRAGIAAGRLSGRSGRVGSWWDSRAIATDRAFPGIDRPTSAVLPTEPQRKSTQWWTISSRKADQASLPSPAGDRAHRSANDGCCPDPEIGSDDTHHPISVPSWSIARQSPMIRPMCTQSSTLKVSGILMSSSDESTRSVTGRDCSSR